jgi:3-hydroxybutyryl-CoA dehydrogenase
MKIAVFAQDSIFTALTEGRSQINWTKVDDMDASIDTSDFDACFFLEEDAIEKDYSKFSMPVFINSVVITLDEKNHGPNVFRINGWPGFVERNHWECAGNLNEKVLNIFKTLGIEIISVPDQPGLVTARVIAMIINEAYYAKSEQVSSEEEIDIAMKLGTNYPKGPFEWKNFIGIRNIHQLLYTMSLTDVRYTPCPLLTKEAES